MSDELKGFTEEQVQRIIAAVKRLEGSPRGSAAGPATYRPPSYSVAEFKLHAALSDASTSGVDAKFWYAGTEGDDVKVYPGNGVGGTVANGTVVICYWWDGKWKFLSSPTCPS